MKLKQNIKFVGTHEAKTTLSKLLKEVEEKHVVVHILRNDKVIAKLCPLDGAGGKDILAPHPVASKIKFLEDPMAPVDEKYWPEESR